MNTENLRAAVNLADSVTGNLRAALPRSSAVQSLALLELIGRAASLARDVDALRAAVAEDEHGADALRAALQKIATSDPKEWCAQTIASAALRT